MKNVMNKVKKLVAGVLAVGMLLVGITFVPKQANATDTVDTATVICKEYTKTDMEKYWNVEPANRTAPYEEGCVFGGWFRLATTGDVNVEKLMFNGTEGSYVPLTEAEMKQAIPEKAYAKFVPAQVLSVKAQNQSKVDADYIANLNPEGTAEEDKDYFWVRVMTSLDSKNYAKIGFDIHLANKAEGLKKEDGSALETTKIYDAVIERVNSEQKVSYATDIFGGASKHLCVWQLSKIDTASNASKIIYVRPYWYTMDGTKVIGLAKYVHIEDEYLNYISVPVNIQSAEKIAAGTMSMSYDYAGLEPISEDENKYFEAGRILPEMNVNRNDANKTFSMVGNAVEFNKYNSSETIYANIRFKKPTVDTELNFDMMLGEFCNWNEDTVENANVKVWDIVYENKANANQ